MEFYDASPPIFLRQMLFLFDGRCLRWLVPAGIPLNGGNVMVGNKGVGQGNLCKSKWRNVGSSNGLRVAWKYWRGKDKIFST